MRPLSPSSVKGADSGGPRTAGWLVIILLGAAALRASHFQGLFAVDDFNYLRHAAEVWKGSYDLSQVSYWHGLRPLVFAPIAVFFDLLGVSPWSAIAWPLAVSLASVLLAFFIGRRMLGAWAGLCAAAALACLPLSVAQAGRVSPEAVINLLVAASVLAFVKAEQQPEAAPTARARWLALSGALYGLQPLAGQLGLLFGIFYLLAVLFFRRHPLAAYAPLLAGAAAALAATAVYHTLLAGDPFIQIRVAGRILETEIDAPRLLFYLRDLLRPLAIDGGLFYLAALGALVGLFTRRREVWLLALWGVGTYAVMEYGSTSLTTYRPLFKQARYLTILSLPAALLAGFAVDWLLVKGARRRWLARAGAATLGLAVAAGSLFVSSRVPPWRQAAIETVRVVGEVVERHRGETIYVTHWLWNSRVGFYMDFSASYFPSGYAPGRAVALESARRDSKNLYVQLLQPGDILEGGLLIRDAAFLHKSDNPKLNLLVHTEGIPAAVHDPPQEWRLERRVGSVELYVIAAGGRFEAGAFSR